MGGRSACGSNFEFERFRPNDGSIGIEYKGISKSADELRDANVGSVGNVATGGLTTGGKACGLAVLERGKCAAESTVIGTRVEVVSAGLPLKGGSTMIPATLWCRKSQLGSSD